MKPRPWGTITVAAVIVVFAAVVFSYVGVLSSQKEEDAAARLEAVIAESERPFGQNYRTLPERLEATFPPGMSMTGAHIHPTLEIFVDGEQVAVPGNIGIHPDDTAGHAPVHTHEPDGTMHVEGPAQATLGQIFQVWGVDLSPTKLGPHEASGDKTVRMWVDGKPSNRFDDLVVAGEQRIVIAYGDAQAPPPTDL